MIFFSIFVILVLLFFSGYLSGMETAIIGSSPGKIQRLKSEGNKKAATAMRLLKMKEKVNNALLMVNSVSNTTCTTLAASLLISIYGEELGTILGSTVMSVLIIVFAEVIPKAIAVPNAEKITLSVAGFVEWLIKVMHPINYVLDIVVRVFCFVFRINLNTELSGAEELRGAIEHQHEEGNVFKEDRDMLGGVLDISAMPVSSIMVHRSNMKTIDGSMPIKKMVSAVLSMTHTRIPVYRGTKDNIIGILHIRDLLKSLHDNDFNYSKINLNDFITPPWFIPEHALVNQQLNEFRRRRTHFALVVDEYGEIKGLVTLEDVLEEIVGQIDDEHDAQETHIVKKSDTSYVVRGTVSVRDLNREKGWDLPDDDAHTIAGMIIQHARRLPEQGESFHIQNLKFTVLSREKNRLKTIAIELLPQ